MKIIRGQCLLTSLNNHGYKRYLQIMVELCAKQEFPGKMKYLRLHVKKICPGFNNRKKVEPKGLLKYYLRYDLYKEV